MWVGAPEVGDAVGAGASGSVGAAADDRGDLGVRQPSEVVVGNDLFLLVGQTREGIGQVRVCVGDSTGSRFRNVMDRQRSARRGATEVDRLSMRDGDERT